MQDRRMIKGGRDRIWLRIVVITLAVAAVALAVVAVGVLQVASSAFAKLMMEAGESAEHAHAMFDESIALVFGLAALVAALLTLALAVLLARRLARPLERIAAAAHQLADGDLSVRVPEDGPAELRELARAYNTMAERLAEQEVVRREFVVNASHELRTPLTNLQGYLEALRDGVIAPEPAVFDSLREEIDRLTRLAASLDVLAGAGGARDPATELDLGAAVRAAVELVTPAMARRGLALRVAAPDGLAVHARPDDLAQVLGNLLQNAMRYTPAGGEVAVTADRIADGVRVRIENSGPGIPPDDLPRVWERFYRVEKSRDPSRGGAGIGLAIVRQLVEAAGGRVGATSEDGRTEFWFLLPS